jgi:type IV pilus assembly protein PilA
MFMPRARKGFTLIELLIVVVIIGILAAVAIPKFGNTKSSAQVATLKSDLRNLATAQETYFSQFNQYGEAIGSLTPTYFNPSANVTVTVTTFAGGFTGTASFAGVSTNCTLTIGGTLTTDGQVACP